MTKPSGQWLWFSQCITEEEQREATNDTALNCRKGHSPMLSFISDDRNVGRRNLSFQRK